MYKNITFPVRAEYSYFFGEFRLKVFLWVVVDYSVWYFPFINLDGVEVIVCILKISQVSGSVFL